MEDKAQPSIMLWIKLLAQQLLTSRTEVALTNEDNEGQRKRIGALAGPINQARGTIEEPEVELKSNGLCKHDYRSGSPPHNEPNTLTRK